MTLRDYYGGGATGPMPFYLDEDSPGYEPGRTYERRSVTEYDGSLWFALQDVTGVTPDEAAPEWMLLLQGVSAADREVIATTVAAAAAVGTYTDTAEGLSATADGQTFWVPVGDYLQLYLNNGGVVAEEQVGVLQPMKSALDGVETGLGDRITALEVVTIEDLAVDPSETQELGTTVTPELAWSFGGTATPQELRINGAVQPDPEATEWIAPAPIADTTSYTVLVEDVLGRTDFDTVAVTFQPPVFWGVASSAALDSAGVIGLSGSELRANHNISKTVNATGEYVYVAFPTSFGAASVYRLFGFDETPIITTISVTTAAGYTADYYVYRSPNQLTGSVPVEVS